MQLTKFSDYALRVLIHLAVADGQRLSTRDIAAAQSASFNHLAKVTQWLANEGYVHATRGRQGGMVLARTPEEISIGTLMRKAEAGSAIVECLRADGGACALSPACGLTGILSEAQEAFFACLDTRSLADIINANQGIARIVHNLHAAAR